MAAYITNPHSLRVGPMDPVTPIHSPQHSVNSSTSSRAPLNTLTLHEYRKQQNSPASQSATPTGKTLRRKAAASGLNEVERVSSTSRQPLRPLHFSQSAYQLNTQPFPPSPPHFHQQQSHFDQPFRSLSAEPYGQGSIGIQSSQSSSVGKVRNFKPIKRLPRPPAANGVGPPPSLASVTSTRPRLSPLHAISFPYVEHSNPSDTQTTPSTFSLSRFPQPPFLVDPSLSPPNAENEAPRVNTASFATTAPVTPPATPAVVHYRGASFDLVNPHASLKLDAIETPSREIESQEYLPLQLYEDPLSLEEMAPKRAIYGDLTSAHASIAQRNDGFPNLTHLGFPQPPRPVAQSPSSSQYTSPFQSPDSNLAVSPLAVQKPSNESRFSLKQLTRNLTKRLGRTTDEIQEQELQEFPDSRVSLASASFDGDFPRPLSRSYRMVTAKSTDSFDDPPTPVNPVSPLDRAVDLINQRSSDASYYQSQRSARRNNSAPLTSMVPDDHSTQIGRAPDPRISTSDGHMTTRPYYDDLASIYPSSSVYTGDDERKSIYPISIASNRKSNPFRVSEDADALATTYRPDSLYAWPSSPRTSRRTSRPLTQEFPQRSVQQGDKTDTISGFIDQYKRGDSSNVSQPVLNREHVNQSGPVRSSSVVPEDPSTVAQQDTGRVSSGLSQFDFGIPHMANLYNGNETTNVSIQAGPGKRANVSRGIGSPPPMPPLEPAFEYDELYSDSCHAAASEMISGVSSYGDTRQLLQMSQPVAGELHPGQTLEPSSSYSQPHTQSSSHNSPEALAQAEQIFADAAEEQQGNSIPAMWARRNSGDLLRNRSQVANDTDDTGYEQAILTAGDAVEREFSDWETVVNDSQGRGRLTDGESIADYSSSEGSRDSLGFSSSLPVLEDEPLEPGSFSYQHPSSLGIHTHPFNSSPPPLIARASVRSAPNERPISPPVFSPPLSPTMPAFVGISGEVNANATGSLQNPTFQPWMNPLFLSDKETQELLESGPNEDILYDDEHATARERGPDQSFQSYDESSPSRSVRVQPPTTSTLGAAYNGPGLSRENTFDLYTTIGPRGNITGTPLGTGMKETGSSVAGNSSPGAILSSSAYDRTKRYGSHAPSYTAPKRTPSVRGAIPSFDWNSSSSGDSSENQPGFYATPGRVVSVTRVPPGLNIPEPSGNQERTPSQVTLFPRIVPESPPGSPSRRSSRFSFKTPASGRRTRRGSRAAVPGQTKLRNMVLAPDAQTVSSGNSTTFSQFIGAAGGDRPSTSNTNTPLRTRMSVPTLPTVLANENSPHLLCPERAYDPEEEEIRRKLSWMIFALFCVLPPVLILYRWMGDLVIVHTTEGRFSHVSAKPKRIALGVGIVVNVGISAAILLPILISHATGAL